MKMIRDLNDSLISEANCLDFVQIARFWALGKGSPTQSARMAQESGASPRVVDLLRKAVGGTVTDSSPGYGSELGDFKILASSFIGSLRDAGAYDRILADAVQLPPRTRIIAVTTGASGSRIGESQPKQLTQIDLDSDLLDARKSVCEVVVSADLLKLGGNVVLQFLQSELRKGLAAATDLDFIAVITNGVSPTTGGASLLEDLAAAIGAITSDAQARFYALLSPANLKAAATMVTAAGEPVYPTLSVTGGTLQGVQILPCDGAGDDLVVLDATQLAMSPGDVELRQSTHGNVDLSGGSNPTTSLWQENLVAVRAERFYGVKPVRDGAVAIVEDVDYSGDE